MTAKVSLVLAVLVWLSLVSNARADLFFAGARALEAMPGERWLEPLRRGLTVAVGQPVTVGGAAAAHARLGVGINDGIRVGVGIAQLQGAAFRRSSTRAAIDVEVLGWGARVQFSAVDDRVGDIARAFRTRGVLAFRLTASTKEFQARWGVRVEAPLATEDLSRTQLTIATRVRREAIALGLSRESSRYGSAARWQLGVAVQLAASLGLALRAGDGTATVVMDATAGALRLRLAIPAVSSWSAGPWMALYWGAGP